MVPGSLSGPQSDPETCEPVLPFACERQAGSGSEQDSFGWSDRRLPGLPSLYGGDQTAFNNTAHGRKEKNFFLI